MPVQRCTLQAANNVASPPIVQVSSQESTGRRIPGSVCRDEACAYVSGSLAHLMDAQLPRFGWQGLSWGLTAVQQVPF